MIQVSAIELSSREFYEVSVPERATIAGLKDILASLAVVFWVLSMLFGVISTYLYLPDYQSLLGFLTGFFGVASVVCWFGSLKSPHLSLSPEDEAEIDRGEHGYFGKR